MAEPRNPRLVAGLVLIALGVVLFIFQRMEGLGPAALFFVLGAAFLTAYFLYRQYGYLIPGCILTGLGAGSLWTGSFFRFDASLLGLGFGFVAIFLIALLYERRTHWWPLIPGGVLILMSAPDTGRILDYLFENWPLILIAVGVLMLLGSLRRPRSRGAGRS